ncbi:hypothetical protein [Nocardia acidivorans]|uniref:hypothetical protein n=1 Tax=Nocardia acidivorans TaxID=404580 RepID=UPI000A8D1C34|nr:hypothetical protein [Nocardia acidivorans]
MTEQLDKFSWMKAFAYNGQKLPAEAAIVIWHHINSESLEWNVSYEDMAHASGKSTDAMEAQVKKLVSAGWLTITARGGRGKKTRYRLAVPEGFDWSRCVQDYKGVEGVHTPNKGRTRRVVGGVDAPVYRDNQSPTEIDLYREYNGGADTPVFRAVSGERIASVPTSPVQTVYRWTEKAGALALPDIQGKNWNPFLTAEETTAFHVRHVIDNCQGLSRTETNAQLRQHFSPKARRVEDLAEYVEHIKE